MPHSLCKLNRVLPNHSIELSLAGDNMSISSDVAHAIAQNEGYGRGND